VMFHGTSYPNAKSILLSFGHVQILFAVFQITDNLGSGPLVLTLIWGVYALMVLGWAFAKRDQTIGQSAVLILTAVSLKGAFYDLPSSDNLTRVYSLLAAGILLYFCGWIYKQIKQWS